MVSPLVFLDIWASWCKDCIVSLPEYKKLRKEFGEEKVAYVLLSVDEDEKKWKSAISKFEIEGEHYRVSTGWKNPLSNYVELDWVPRYIVFDERGMIIQPKSVKLTDKSLQEALEGK